MVVVILLLVLIKTLEIMEKFIEKLTGIQIEKLDLELEASKSRVEFYKYNLKTLEEHVNKHTEYLVEYREIDIYFEELKQKEIKRILKENSINLKS